MLGTLFLVFLKMGCISFGGGYTVIPMIERDVRFYGWMTDQEFQRVVSLAGMAPGPIATNSATLIGFDIAGLPGAITATAGMVLPSLVIIIIIVAFLMRFRDHRVVKAFFYGLRPAVTALIIYAAIRFGFISQSGPYLTWSTLMTLLITAGCLYGVLKYKLHPVVVIIASGFAGIILF
ncbi:chromate transporter [Paenibacillus eucommiae]|uniref:Chromate transporter n=1 Tax=Paenibacillus eucommiae TaxID=1355755 RepID=A0ABS4IWL0_9BACL|nr:chromate transporter [Paenibacillus eucommiae]MBP1991977.1 chromate transporter [Paenibacillus eucommiae]